MYKDLSLKEKSELFKLMVSNGITDINEIERIYNSYQDGGNKISADNLPESQQYAVTTPDGQRKVFNTKEEAQQYITANTPKGYSLYDTTNYGTNIDKGQTAILDRNTEREIEKATKQEELAKARLATIQQNKEASKEMLSYMPIIGDGMDLYQLGKDAYNGNYLNAGIGLGLLALPNVIEKPIKYVGKGIKKLFTKQPDWDNIIKQISKLEPMSFPKEKTYIPDQIDSETSKRLNDFWNNIFMGKYTSNRDRVNKNKVFRESIPGEFTSIKSTDPVALKDAIGHSYQGNAYIYSDINTIDKDDVVIHEGAHNFRDTKTPTSEEIVANFNTDPNKRPFIDDSKYTSEEIDYLDDAYTFTSDYNYNDLDKYYLLRLAEKGSTNTQLQYALYKKYNIKNISELNNIIDNLTNDDLLYELQQTNGYGRNFVKQLRTLPEKEQNVKITNIRNALKYVPATIGATTGLSLINNNNQNVKRFGGKINKFKEGGLNITLPEVVVSPRNSYYTYTGKETVTPTWQEFAKAKQNEARDDAYLGMLSQGKPIVPEIPNQNTFAKLINVGMTTFGANDQDVIKVVGKEGPENVFTCINTVTGQYDDCNQVSGNITFSKSPSKYGFKEVNTPRIGDLVQFTDNTGTPHHAAMVTGFDENGEPIISYSDGGWESESMKYDKDTWKKDFEGDTWKYYTFIGNRKNASKWREEYDKKFKNKVK